MAGAAGPCVQLWTESSVRKVAEALDVELTKRQKTFKRQIEALEAVEALKRAGISLHERHTNRLGMEAFAEQFGHDYVTVDGVTHLIHGDPGDSMCEIRDIEAPDEQLNGEEEAQMVLLDEPDGW